MADIKIRIGAALDSSFDATMASAEKRGQKAAQRISQAQTKEAQAGQKAYQSASRAFERNEAARANAGIRLAKEGTKAEQREWDMRLRASRRAADEQQRLARRVAQQAVREARSAAREEQKIQRALRRDAERMERMQGSTLDRFARRTSYRASRFFAPNLPIMSTAGRLGREAMMGLGIDMNWGSSIRRVTELEKLVAQTTRQAWRPQSGDASAKLMPTQQAMSGVLGVATRQALDPMEAAQSLANFVARTGDIRGGMALMEDAAKVAGATSAGLDDVMETAARLSLQMPNTADKTTRLIGILRQLGGQGKAGAVEFRELASQGAKLASAAARFEGDFGRNMGLFGALAQIGVAKGGAVTAQQVATSAMRFADTLATPARVKTFNDLKINPFTDASRTVLRDPVQTIKAALVASKGDQVTMRELFASSIGARLVTGLTNVYSQTAGGTPAKLAAVDAEINQYLEKSMMSETEVREANNRRLEGTAAKAQQFQNEFDGVTRKMMASLLPALEKLAPVALKSADAFSRVVSWSAENPMKAVGAALGAAILRAGIESSVRAALEEVILRSALQAGLGGVVQTAGGGVLAAGGGQAGLAGMAGMGLGGKMIMGGRLAATKGLRAGFKGGGLMGGLGATAAVLGSAALAYEGASLAMDQWDAAQNENKDEGGFGAAFDKAGGWGGLWDFIAGNKPQENAWGRAGSRGIPKARWDAAMAEADRRKANAGTLDPTGAAVPSAGAEQSRQLLAAQQGQADALRGLRDKLGGTLRVQITNPEDIRQRPPTGVPSEGRALR